jgi:hypothetical protein
MKYGLILITVFLCSLTSYADVIVERVVPNKITYRLNEDGTMKVVLSNTSANSENGEIRFTESYDLDKTRQISTVKFELKPKETKTIEIPYNSGKERYGRGICAEAIQNGKTVSRKNEYYNVINEWFRVNMGTGAGTAGTLYETSHMSKLCQYYGLPFPKMQHTWYPSEEWNQYDSDAGPFFGYGNTTTRWQMQRCSVGGNEAAANMPPDELWYAGSNKPRKTSDIAKDTVNSHMKGAYHTRFTINNIEGPYGFELARKRPEDIMRNNRGGFEGHFMSAQANPVQLAKIDQIYHEWTYLRPNFFKKSVLEWAVDDLIKGIKGMNEDGVYFDGRYCSREGFDHLGNDLTKIYDRDKHIIESLKYVRERLRAANPNWYIWSNGCDASDPESEMLNDPQSGVLKEIQVPFILNPNSVYNSWRGLMDSLLYIRNQCWVPAKGSRINTKIIHVGYFAFYNCQAEQIKQTREYWTFNNHLMSLVAANAMHPYAPQIQYRNFKQMMTRFSELYWHEDINLMRDGYKKFNVDSLREIWSEDTIYTRETPEYTDYYIHLVNVPEKEKVNDLEASDPHAADDVEVSSKLFGDSKNLKAWAIQPYGYDAKVLEPLVNEVTAKKVKNELVFAIPEFKYYSLLVIRAYKK